MKFLAPRHDYQHGAGWSRRVADAGTEYVVGVERGKRVRLRYRSGHGHQWWGFVRTPAGRTLWEGRVAAGIGCKGLVAAYRRAQGGAAPERS